VPWMLVRQTGQSLREGAHRTQEQRWPQGRKTTPTSPSMQILQVLCSFNLAFSDSRSSFGELGAVELVVSEVVVVAFLLLLEEAASSLNSAEMEASSCSCCWLLLVLELEEVVAELPGAAAGVDDDDEVVVVEVAGDLGVRLTVLPIDSSTSILISSPKRFANSTLSLLLLPSPSPRLVSVAPEGFKFSNLDLRCCSL